MNVGLIKNGDEIQLIVPSQGINLATHVQQLAGQNPYKIMDNSLLPSRNTREYWTWSGNANDNPEVNISSYRQAKLNKLRSERKERLNQIDDDINVHTDAQLLTGGVNRSIEMRALAVQRQELRDFPTHALWNTLTTVEAIDAVTLDDFLNV